MPLSLVWKGSTTLPIDGEILRPDALAGLSAEQVARRAVRVGNAEAALGDLFAVSGDVGDGEIDLEGDLRPVRGIARGMASGLLRIRGDAGPGLARGLHGGRVEVEGSAGDSAGSGMRGGVLHIRGSAGDNLGGAEPGARLGMREGVILVEGSAGRDVGLSMRRGLIAVGGDLGDGAGRAMVAGSIFGFGRAGIGLGAGMKRGSIVLFDPEPPRLSPTFAPSGRDRPTFVTIYLQRLRAWGLPVPEGAFSGLLARYNGDRAEGGQGEVLLAASTDHGGPSR